MNERIDPQRGVPHARAKRESGRNEGVPHARAKRESGRNEGVPHARAKRESGRGDDACRTLERTRTRTCIGCGVRDDSVAMMRLTVDGAGVIFDPRSPRGRGAHLHARPACIRRAPRGLGRAFKGRVHAHSGDLGRGLLAACERRMVGLLRAAQRRRVLAIGTAAATAALAAPHGAATLAIVAVDAGSVCHSTEVERAITAGRAIAWKTKSELGDLLGVEAVSLCAVRDAVIASELKLMRSAVDAAMAATREGVECSPEAR
jgi:predicted RNA-binding protein YlxR (DUF448 family)/ribosomal protein L7Ae-like RNA K-turn-binding protein